jgi:hypothetical protein
MPDGDKFAQSLTKRADSAINQWIEYNRSSNSAVIRERGGAYDKVIKESSKSWHIILWKE